MGTILKRKRGIALLWALVICLVMLIITGTMVSTIVKDSQSSVRIEESAQAYAAAKSGIDWGIWCLSKQSAVPCSTSFDLGRGRATVDIKASDGTTVIKSTGSIINGAVRRVLRYELKPTSSCDINKDVLESGINFSPNVTTESFKIQFDFWMSELGNDFTFGIANTAGDNLAMVVDGSGIATLQTTRPNVITSAPIPSSADPTPTLTVDSLNPYRYRATIKYIHNISATLEISQRVLAVDSAGGSIERFNPIGSQTIKLIGVSLTQMNSLYIPALFATPSPFYTYEIDGFSVPPEEIEGDGEFILINNHNYIDHISIIGLNPCP